MTRIWVALAAALCLPSSLPAARAAEPAVCPGGLCQAREIVPFLRLLGGARSRPVHILQIGDSHTANENFAGAWRAILQARYGDAGRGVMPPGRPWAGYTTREVTVAQAGDWSQESILAARRHNLTDLVFGASGFRFTSPPGGGEMDIQADPGRQFRRFVVCVATGPGAGTLTLSLGGRATTQSLASPVAGVACPEETADAPATAAGLIASGGPVDVLSWATFSGDPGVVVSNLGVSGSELHEVAPNGDAVLAAEFRAYAPDLIVLAFGTNEGFGPNFSSLDFEQTLTGAIARMRRLSPGTPLLLLGAPDAQSRFRGLAHNSDQGRRASVRGGWFSPPALEDVRAVQRRVAAAEHVALWDWAARMGGVGAARQWPSLDPPLMRPDHVHYTVQGGQRLAERLQADLDAARAAAD